jgi:hypothetical protein
MDTHSRRVTLLVLAVKLFNMLDKDGNGRLTYDELREGLSSVRGMHELPPHRVLQVDCTLLIDQATTTCITKPRGSQLLVDLCLGWSGLGVKACGGF